MFGNSIRHLAVSMDLESIEEILGITGGASGEWRVGSGEGMAVETSWLIDGLMD